MEWKFGTSSYHMCLAWLPTFSFGVSHDDTPSNTLEFSCIFSIQYYRWNCTCITKMTMLNTTLSTWQLQRDSWTPQWHDHAGLVAVGLLFTRAFELRQATLQIPLSQDHAPRIFDDDSFSTPLEDEIEKAAIPSAQLCSICLDAPKNSFLDPCGHCCTCYTCGKR